MELYKKNVTLSGNHCHATSMDLYRECGKKYFVVSSSFEEIKMTGTRLAEIKEHLLNRKGKQVDYKLNNLFSSCLHWP